MHCIFVPQTKIMYRLRHHATKTVETRRQLFGLWLKTMWFISAYSYCIHVRHECCDTVRCHICRAFEKQHVIVTQQRRNVNCLCCSIRCIQRAEREGSIAWNCKPSKRPLHVVTSTLWRFFEYTSCVYCNQQQLARLSTIKKPDVCLRDQMRELRNLCFTFGPELSASRDL